MRIHTVSPRALRHGHSLMELVVAMTSASVLLVGLGSAVLLTSRAFRPETTAPHSRTAAALVERDLLTDLHLATDFTERTDKAVEFLVPDRDGDGQPELLRYAWSGQVGDPLVFRYNNTPEVPVVSDVRSFSLSFLTRSVAGSAIPAEQTGSQILFLVNDSQSPSAEELARKTLFESWNFVVVLAGLKDDPDTILKAAQSAKAIYVSGTIKGSDLGGLAKLAEQPVGIVNESLSLVDDFGFAAGGDTSFSSQLSITNSTHYITTGFSNGSHSVLSMGAGLTRLNSSPSVGLNSLATTSGVTALATIDPGDALQNGDKAAGRRVLVPWGELNPQTLNANGRQLTLRAIEWATGLGSTTANLKNFGYETVFGSSADKLDEIQVATRAQLTESGVVKSISAYVGGRSDELRFAIYSDVAGQPGVRLVQSAVGRSGSAMQWITLTVPDTSFTPGFYWLALVVDHDEQVHRFSSAISGAGRRRKAYDAIDRGFIPAWGTSSSSGDGAISIYATYMTN